MSGSDRTLGLRVGLLAMALGALTACGAGTDSATVATTAPAGDAGATAAKGASAVAGTSSATTATTIAAAAAPGDDAGVVGTQLLSHPDDLQMVMLGYRLRGIMPPLQQWAEAQYAVRTANEFEREATLKSERDRLQAIYDGTAGIGYLRLGVSAELSEYDAARGGYYFTAFTPGSVFNFSAQPGSTAERIAMRVENEEELNFWPLDATAAQEVLRQSRWRKVDLDSYFRITGVTQRGSGPTINVRLQRYMIVSDQRDNPAVLGERNFGDRTNEE